MYGWGTYRGWGAYESCDPRDFACVQRVTAQESGDVQQHAIDQTNAARDACHSNADLSSEPFRSQLNAQCDANFPAGAATGGESVQYWQSVATKPAIADEYATAAQASAEYNAEQTRRAAELRAELARANQTFIPDAAKLPATSSTPLSTIMPKVPANPVVGGAVPASWNFDTSLPAGSSSFALPAASSIPWWGWAAGAGVLFFAFKGGR